MQSTQSAADSNWGRVTRRRILSLIGLRGGAVLLSACAGVSQPSTPGADATVPVTTAVNSAVTTSASAAAAPQPNTGGVLRDASSTDLVPIDGHYHHPGNGLSSWIVYEPLIVYDDNLNPQPLLAESWYQSTDGRRISMTLRKGVQYHTGCEITSDDLVHNLNRILNPKISAGIFSGFIPLDTTWSASDKYTGVISTQQPWVNVFDFLSLFNMVNEESVEGPNTQSSAVGTEPFTLVEWVQGDHATYGKNPNYWMSGRPDLDTIQLTIGKDPQAQEVEFESGAVDFTLLPAINYAIDRQRIAQTVLFGLEQPNDLPWPPETPADEPPKQLLYNHDVDKVKSLFTEAGLIGTSFETLMSNTNPAYSAIAQIIQGDLESIGVTMTLTQMNQGSMLARMNEHQLQGYLAGDVWSNFQPVTVLTADASLNYRVNNADIHDPQYTSLMTAASTEVDPTQRMQLYSQIADSLLDACFDLPLASSSTRALASKQLHGVGHRRNDFFMFTDAWLG